MWIANSDILWKNWSKTSMDWKKFHNLIQQQKVSFDLTFILWILYFWEFKRLKLNAMLTFKMIKISEIWHIWGCYPKSALSTLDNSAWIRIRGGQKKTVTWWRSKVLSKQNTNLMVCANTKSRKTLFRGPLILSSSIF